VGRTESFVSLLEISRKSSCRIEEADKKKQYDSACAAAGQFDMMNLYSSLFNQMDISASQILVTQADFMDPDRLRNLSYTISRLCGLGILPIINENDAVSANLGYTDEDVFSDNDSLAALCARSFDCEVALLLTDVGGVYDRPPGEDGSELIRLWRRDSDVLIGETSSQGRGGMSAKIEAALSAVKPGSRCNACVVAAGSDLNVIRGILSPTYDPSSHSPLPHHQNSPKGTLFITPDTDLEHQA